MFDFSMLSIMFDFSKFYVSFLCFSPNFIAPIKDCKKCFSLRRLETQIPRVRDWNKNAAVPDAYKHPHQSLHIQTRLFHVWCSMLSVIMFDFSMFSIIMFDFSMFYASFLCFSPNIIAAGVKDWIKHASVSEAWKPQFFSLVLGDTWWKGCKGHFGLTCQRVRLYL